MKSHIIFFHPQRRLLYTHKHGSQGRSRLTQDHIQKYFPYRHSCHQNTRDRKSPKGAGWSLPAARAGCTAVLRAAGQPLPDPRCSPNLFSEPCVKASSPEELPLQRSSCISSPAVTGDRWEGNYSYDVNCHFNRLLITALLLMSAIVALRCIIVLSTVLTQGKVIPCMLITFHKLWCIFL